MVLEILWSLFTIFPTAFLWHRNNQEKECSSDSDVVETVDDSDGGGPDIVQISEPDVPYRVRNFTLIERIICIMLVTWGELEGYQFLKLCLETDEQSIPNRGFCFVASF